MAVFWKVFILVILASNFVSEGKKKPCRAKNAKRCKFAAISRPVNKTVYVGQHVKLRCLFTKVKRQYPEVSWYHNGVYLHLDTNDRPDADRVIHLRNDGDSVVFKRAMLRDSGKWSCEGIDQFDRIRWINHTLTVKLFLSRKRRSAVDRSIDKSPGLRYIEKEFGRATLLSCGIPAIREMLDRLSIHAGLSAQERLRLCEGPLYAPYLANSVPTATCDKKCKAFCRRHLCRPRWVDNTVAFTNSYRVALGEDQLMSCRAVGNPTPKVIWYRNGIPILEQVDIKRNIHFKLSDDNVELRLLKVESANDGNYTCIVSNDVGTISHWWSVEPFVANYDRVTINPAYPKNVSVEVGETATFSCPYNARTGFIKVIYWFNEIEWKNLLQAVHNDTHYLGSVTKERNGSIVDVDLVLHNVTEQMAGIYTCLIGFQSMPDIFDAKNATLTVYPKGALHTTVLPLQITKNRDFIQQLFGDNKLHFILSVGGLIVVIVLILVSFIYCIIRQSRARFVLKKQVVIKYDVPAGFAGHDLPLEKNELYQRQEQEEFEADAALIDNRNPDEVDIGNGFRVVLENVTIPRKQDTNPNYPYVFCDVDQKWELEGNKLTVEKTIGEGAFGIVWRGSYTDAKNEKYTVAVKTLKENSCDRTSEEALKDLVSEMQILKLVGHHENVISLIGCCTKSVPPMVVVEYCKHGSVKSFLQKCRPCPKLTVNRTTNGNLLPPIPESSAELPSINEPRILTEADLLSFCCQVACGMNFLSSMPCVHRDLAARNVLVDENIVLKIADFGLTRKLDDEYYRKKTEGRLPLKWMAPESLTCQKYTVKSDVWSFGVFMWEVFTMGAYSPYPGISPELIIDLLQNDKRMDKPNCASVDAYELMLKCWQWNPVDRPCFLALAGELSQLISIAKYQEYNVDPEAMIESVNKMSLAADHVNAQNGRLSAPQEVDSQYNSMSNASNSGSLPSSANCTDGMRFSYPNCGGVSQNGYLSSGDGYLRPKGLLNGARQFNPDSPTGSQRSQKSEQSCPDSGHEENANSPVPLPNGNLSTSQSLLASTDSGNSSSNGHIPPDSRVNSRPVPVPSTPYSHFPAPVPLSKVETVVEVTPVVNGDVPLRTTRILRPSAQKRHGSTSSADSSALIQQSAV